MDTMKLQEVFHSSGLEKQIDKSKLKQLNYETLETSYTDCHGKYKYQLIKIEIIYVSEFYFFIEVYKLSAVFFLSICFRDSRYFFCRASFRLVIKEKQNKIAICCTFNNASRSQLQINFMRENSNSFNAFSGSRSKKKRQI